MADEDDVELEIRARLNEQSAVDAATDLANITARTIDRKLGNRIAGTINKSLEKVGQGGALGKVLDPLNKAAKDAATSLDPLHRRAEQLQGDMAALNERVQATRRTFSQLGADPGLFAVIDRELDKVLVRSRQFNENLEEITRNPDLLRGYEVAFQKASQTIFREIAGNIQPALRSITTAQRIEGNKANEVASRQQQERLQNARLANSRRIVAEQGANAQLLAETRIAGQQQIQQERITARRRIEILRFAAAQLKQIERGIAGAFRATGTILSTTASGVGSGLSRITALFRRSDNSLNDGLRGALIRREQTIDRSFRRQTSDIRRETIQQSQTIQRFERQASTGLAGALTGRSSLGALFGGGLAIGGGFAAFQGLRNGLDVGGDFVQGLAVLGAQLELTEKQIQGVREQSIELGNDISLPGVSALDAAQAIQILAKQFANLGETALPAAQGAARGVLQLARAAGVDAEEAARVVGAAVNVFGVNAKQAVLVADQVTNALTKAAGVGFGDFADAFTQSAGVVNLFTGDAAKSTKVLAEFNAAIAILAKNGLIGSDAGTSLKQFFLQANRGTEDATEKLEEITAAAGVTGSVFFDAAGNARLLSDSLDILRAGTRDLNNQQLTATLGKLFGSDAARAAAFLIKSTAAEFDGLVTSILEQGSAADIAAAQNTGLRGALDALASVIETQQIRTYERFQGVLGRVVIRFAELLQAFFEGRGRMGQFKAALTGVAVALGGLLVAKAVGEAFQFMALGLRATITPLGTLVVGLAALGGAVALLREISPDFREETNAIGDSIRGRLTDGLRLAADGLARLSRFLRTEVVPRFVEFGVAVADRVLPFVARLSEFVTGKMIPALSRAGELLRTAVLPAFRRVGDIIATEVVPRLQIARDFVLEVVGGVATLIQPAIDGFRRLGDAIRTAFDTDDTTGIRPALSGLRDGLLETFRNVGDRIVELLGPQLLRVQDFLADQFAPRNMERVVVNIAGLAFRIGETLGSIVSDPKFVAALEGIAAAFAATAVIALAGFGKGVVENLPELGKLLVDQFQFVFNEVFEDGISFKAVAKLVVGGLAAAVGTVAVITALTNAFKRPVDKAAAAAGKTGGQSFIRSFGSTMRTGFTGSLNNPFATGFFGGIGGLERQAREAADKANTAFLTEQARFGRRLKLLNQQIRIDLSGDGPLFDTRKQFQDLQQTLGPEAVAGASFRASLGALRTDVSNIFKGIGLAISRNTTDGFAVARQAAGNFGRDLRDLARNTVADMRAVGVGIGQALGGSIVSGVGAALSGRVLGESDSRFGQGIGLAGIITSALFAGASVGGGPQGLIVGGVVAAIGGLTAVVAASGQAAKRAAAEVAEYADALRDVRDAAGLTEAAADVVLENIRNEDVAVRELLRTVGFDAAAFAEQVIAGTFDLRDALTLLRPALGDSAGVVISELTRLEREGVSPVEALTDALNAADGAIALQGLGTLRRALDKLSPEQVELVTAALDALLDEGGELREGLDIAALDRDLQDLAGSTTAALEATTQAARDRRNELEGFFGDLGRLNVAEDDVARRRAAARPDIQEQIIGDISSAIESLNQQRLDAINTQIANLTGQLDAAKLAAETALTSVLDLVQNPLADPFTQAFDQLLLGVEQAGQQLQELLGEGINIEAAFGDLSSAEGALVRQVIDSFSNAFSAAVAQAITDNPGISTEELRAKFQPIFDEIARGKIEIPDAEGNLVEVNLPPAAQRLLIDTLNSLLANPALEMGLENVLITDKALADAQRQLEEANLALGLRVQFSPAQIAEELRRLGLGVSLGSVLGFLEAQAVAEDVARARALADQTPQERREQPLPPPIVFNQTVNQTISGGGMPVETASQSAAAMRTAVVVGVIPRLNTATASRS